MSLQSLYDNFTSRENSQVDNERIVIIDGLNMFIRSFLAVPTVNHNGKHVGALVGFLRGLASSVTNFNPTQCVVIFDGLDCAYKKRQLYPDYKAQRKNKMRLNRFVSLDATIGEDRSFEEQLVRLEMYLNTLPITFFMMNYAECDDVVGYMVSEIYTKPNQHCTIISADKDFLQLAADRVNVFSPTKKKLYTSNDVAAEYLVSPKNYLTFRALTGDESDNIKGVPGAGIKTLLKYIPEIGTTDMTCAAIIEYCKEKVAAGAKYKIYSTIVNNSELLLLNERLMQLSDAELSGQQKLDIQKWAVKKPEQFNNYEFRKLFKEDGLIAYDEYFLNRLTTSFNQLNYYQLGKR